MFLQSIKAACLTTLVFAGTTLPAKAQTNDLLDALDQATPQTKEYTTATFKSTRIINGHSVENTPAKHLDFRIAHRFGTLNTGLYELFGLDQANIRLSFEYGINDRLMVGAGRSNYQKTYDAFVKYKLLRQSTGGKYVMPATVSVLFAPTVSSLAQFATPDYFANRFTYTTQLLIARKFSEKLSLQLTPTFIHRNLVETLADENDVFALGIGGRYKISKRVSFNGEYFYLLPGHTADNYTNMLALGFDIETGGHVFQLMFTNSVAMIEKAFIAENDGKWGKGDIHFGFNISRTFSFDKDTKQKTKQW